MDLARVEEIFHRSASLPEPERERVLEEECAGDRELERRVRELLALTAETGEDSGTILSLFVQLAPTVHGQPDSVGPAQPALAVGTVLDSRYEVLEFVAAGGMGQVYRVRDLGNDVVLALKTVHPKLATASSLRRFKQEVLLARSISHPGVCRIFDIGRDGETGVTYLTMEFLEGETLSARIKAGGAMSVEESIPLVLDMTQALEAAHRAGIVHLDFKSSNVMIVPGEERSRAVITDFGLATTVGTALEDAEETDGSRDDHEKLAAGRGTGSRIEHRLATRIVGTPLFMSPEQVIGGRIGPPSDLYSLGVVLFQMATGTLPFLGDSAIATSIEHVTKEPPLPSSRGDVDEVWDRTILRLLSKSPDDRYKAATDVARALQGRASDTPVIPHRLPPERDPFVGRRQELVDIEERLAPVGKPPSTRLLTIAGPGGAGKTRLAQRFGWETLDRWPGGVWFADLTEARSLEGVAQVTARVLEVALGSSDPVGQLGGVLAQRGRCLIVLDNFEQVADVAEAVVGRWCDETTEACFLVTSRERLRLPAEEVCPIGPLEPGTQGVELFEARGWSHRPEFLVDESNRSRVEEIVAKLDGFPLAIEMAAALLRSRSVEQLSVESFQALAGTKGGRHASLTATVDWSWNLLEAWEQSAVAQMSVFAGGFVLGAAEAVIDLARHADAPAVLDVIGALIDKSWLRQEVILGEPRFSMYKTLQDYARTRLHNGEPDEVQPSATDADAGSTTDFVSAFARDAEIRHGSYFAAIDLGGAARRLARPNDSERRAARRLELDNLQLACRRAILRHDGDVAARSYLAAYRELVSTGPHSIVVRLGRDVVNVAKGKHRARVLLELGHIEQLAGLKEEALGHIEMALETSRAEGLTHEEAEALGILSALYIRRGDTVKAREIHGASVKLALDAGKGSIEPTLHSLLARINMMEGKVEEAQKCVNMAVQGHRANHSRRGEAIALGLQGLLRIQLGQLEEGRDEYEEVLAILRELKDQFGIGVMLSKLGALYQKLGDSDTSRKRLVEGESVLRELGNNLELAILLCHRSDLEHSTGALETARTKLREANVVAAELSPGANPDLDRRLAKLGETLDRA